MKRFIISILTVVLSLVAYAEPSAADADALARDGKYAEAADAYEAILNGGQESAGLYYNLGYSYFKQGMLGRAILNFERCQRLNPSDPDVEANLALAYALTDKMQEIEPLFITKLWRGLCDALSSDGWAVVFVVLFFLIIAGLCCFFFVNSVALRKVGFFSAAVLAIFAIVALSISLQKRADVLNSDEAIIMVSSATLATSPDKNGSEMAVLHEGTKVVIIDQLGEWVEVKLKDGNVGWLLLSSVEKI